MAKDLCIMCGKETAYDFETHIDYRVGYIEGAGQLCYQCYNKGHNESSFEPKLTIVVDEDTILNTPNDFDLGEKVRQAYWKIKGI